MAKARSSKTLESVTKRITLNGTTLAQEEMRFGLADNEIGQMCLFDIEYQPGSNDSVGGSSAVALSLDPDSNLDPLTDDVEDLEYLGGMVTDGVDPAGTIGKTIMLPDKVNFGTNIGLTAIGDTANKNSIFIVTIWFLRKKASSIELAKILLKRR
jgi:hypothetical protein